MSSVATTSAAAAAKPASSLSEQELTNTFRTKQSEIQALVNKIGELERDADEHALVIETMAEANATEPDRKCFRLINTVLVERTVKDVLPELRSNHDQIKEVMETLLKEYKKKETEFSEWQRVNNIVVRQRQ